jgi:hypothetical protein
MVSAKIAAKKAAALFDFLRTFSKARAKAGNTEEQR